MIAASGMQSIHSGKCFYKNPKVFEPFRITDVRGAVKMVGDIS